MPDDNTPPETSKDLPPQPLSTQPQSELKPAMIITSRGTITSPMSPRSTYQYRTLEMQAAIEDYYASGLSLHAIAAMDGMPSYGMILRWVKEDAGLRQALEGARVVRALHFEEEALRAAEAAIDKDDVPAARLKFDGYVWGAKVNNPDRYGNKTQLSGDPDRPLTFNISTGVPISENDKAIELNSDGTIKSDVSTDNA